MASRKQLSILKQGVEVWNIWRETNHRAGRPGWFEVDLRRARLRSGQFWEINFHEADLRGVDLREARLHEANLSRANLAGANLSNADLSEANLSRADLTDADLAGAILWGAYLSRAKVQNINASGMVLAETTLVDLDFSTASGLDSIKYKGPSHVDLNTIKTIPSRYRDAFLRGCGLPDIYIEFLPSILDAIQFYSCFISYSTADQAFADRLHADLQANGVRCWFAPHNVRSGNKLHEQIDEAIRLYDRLLLILSEASMNSEWVGTEIAYARQKEQRERRKALFPIGVVPFERIQEWKCFDADNGKDSAREVREYFIPDFSNWKDHDEYKQAFYRLLRDLKATTEASK
jgi:uncharacterized protein YjbI with pentapeptide repeats